MKKNICLFLLLIFSAPAFGQRAGYWQQKADYQMDIDVDEVNARYDGKMNLTYTNNSPDDLDKVYFHLYYNAFQPGSAMDLRLQNINDPDSRMMTTQNGMKVSRISLLGKDDVGFQKINSIKQNGKNLNYKISGTIMTVDLSEKIKSGQSTVLEIDWKAQIPETIRRGGKNSREGVALTMTQWYPKIAAYDEEGWHLDEYIGREFYAPFGDFDVKINIRKDFVIGGSGVLQNPNEVKGYVSNPNLKIKNGKVNWHFKAKNIHDFAWAADKNYVVSNQKVPSGPEIYFVHLNQEELNQNWEKVKTVTSNFFEFMSERFGQYPWETYSIVQGGDGGMEYGTATMVTGGRNINSLVGVIFHEVAHSWFQHMFGINETVNEWMDEGFTSYSEQLAHLKLSGKTIEPNSNPEAYDAYFQLARSGVEEPMSLMADYYNYNYAYGIEAYVKGQIYLIQLGYIIGDENLNATFKEFYKEWKFKHPTPNDFKRTAEKVSGLNLKWYQNLFVNTVRTIDYSIESVKKDEIKLKNLSNFPMPIDLLVEYSDGSRELFYIPNLELRGEKPAENIEIYKDAKRTVLNPWAWTAPEYSVKILKEVKSAVIDPTKRLADIDFSNNTYKK
ncbi:MAG: M1 family metallopeptidase [Weeksellaceae bacterium]